MEKESVQSVAIQYVKLMAGLALILFNLWHLAKAEADSGIQMKCFYFAQSSLKSLDEMQLQREKAKSNFDLFLEQSKK